MHCPTCQHENRSGRKFCSECGAAFELKCPSCGAANEPDEKFCGECGAQLQGVKGLGGLGLRESRSPQTPNPLTPSPLLPRHLADKILQSKSALEGERKQVTVLFADVKGSMELSEQMDPEEWSLIMQRFFAILSEGVERFDGFVDKFTGDGIMALFGAPIAHEDHAQRGCFAALHLCDALRDYAHELRREHGVDLSARIGLNSGEVVVGKIGDDLRMDYTAQGHTVGLAQRMEQLAEPGLPYVSEAVAKLVDGYFQLNDLGEFKVKGASAPMRAYGLEGVGALRTRLEMSRSRGFSRFVGRTDELGALQVALGRALEGHGGVVGVVADAGVGKSRLCLEFVQHCRGRGIAVFEAHCPSYGASVPLLPILELMRGFFAIADNDSDQQAREKIAGRMLLLDRSLEELLPLAFEFLGVPDPQNPCPPIDPAARQRQLLAFVRRLLQARSEREPAVLLIDDVHWIDAASDALVAALIETLVATRTLTVLNFRPEYSAEWMSRSSYQQLPLHPLGDAAIDELLGELLGHDPSLQDLVALIRERTGGNPFYVEEMVRSLVESGSLTGERGAYRMEGAIDRIVVPPTVQGILAARIDRIGEHEKQVLQCAAAIGRVFGEKLLRRVCELPATEIDAALAELCRAELIHQESLYPEVEYAFRHPLTHEVAEGTQLTVQRRRVHAAIAGALEEISAGKDEQAALLAHHWELAGEAEPAALCHRRAAEWIGGSDSSAATRHWQRVRALADEIADPQLADELGERSRLLILEHGWRRGIPQEEADALLREGEAWARRRENPLALARFYSAYGMAITLSLGLIARTVELFDEALRLARAADDRGLAFAIELRLALCAWYRGDVRDFARRVEAVNAYSVDDMETAAPLVGYDARAFAVGLRGAAAYWSGRFDDAAARLAEAIALARAAGAVEVVGWHLSLQASLHWALGDTTRALAAARESMEIAERVDSALSRAVACSSLSRILGGSGDLESGVRFAREAVEYTRQTVRPTWPEALSYLAELRCAAGAVVEAREIAERALRIAVEAGFGLGRMEAELTLARISLAGTDEKSLDDAARFLDRAAGTYEETGCLVKLPHVFELRAQVAQRRNDAGSAAAALRQAQQHYREMGAPLQVERLEKQIRGAASSAPSL